MFDVWFCKQIAVGVDLNLAIEIPIDNKKFFGCSQTKSHIHGLRLFQLPYVLLTVANSHLLRAKTVFAIVAEKKYVSSIERLLNCFI